MRKAAMLALVVLQVGCARSGADWEIDDMTVDPAQGEDGGASGGEATAGTTNTGASSTGGSGGTSGGISTGGASGASTGTSGDASTGGMSTGSSTGGTSTGGTSTGGTSTGGTSTGGTSTGGTSTGGTSTGGTSTGGTTGVECPGGTITCEQGTMLGSLDASDETSTLKKQGTGSGWFSVDLSDGNLNNMGNSRIGVRATLTVSSGSYQVRLVGDTGPSGAGRCAVADVTDTTPLSKTAIWGSYGPVVAKTRALTFHVEHLSGACDGQWTLTISGNPCPAATFGFGEDSLGSCP